MPVPFAQPQTFSRTAAGAYVNGTFVPGASTSFSANCSIQSVSDNQIEIKPREGSRWLDGMIAIVSESAIQEQDRTTYEGVLYEVIKTNHWPQLAAIAHYEAFAQRINGNTN